MSDHPDVISLADRELGTCPGCREPVLFAENFIRAGRAFVHVTCALSVDAADQSARPDYPRPVPPLPPGA